MVFCDTGLFAAAYTEKCIWGQSRFEAGGVCELDDDAAGGVYYYDGSGETLEMMNG